MEEKKSGVRERSSLGSTAYRNQAGRAGPGIGAAPTGLSKNLTSSQNGIQTPNSTAAATGVKSYAGSTSSYNKGYVGQYDAGNSNLLANSMKSTNKSKSTPPNFRMLD
jgi:hypothetical protein